MKIKKILCYSFALLLLCSSTINQNAFLSNESKTNNNYLNDVKKHESNSSIIVDGSKFDSSGMLYSIDAVKSDGTGLKTCSKLENLVLNKEFIKDELEKHCYTNTAVNGAGSSVSNIISTNSMREFTSKFDTQFSLDSNVTANKDIFHGSISEQFKYQSSINYSKFISSYFYTHSTISHRYSLIIDNKDDVDEFKSNLTSTYITNLKEYLKGNLSFVNFVNKYGTHIVTAANYGGFIITYYTIVSNKYNFTSDVATQMGNSITLGIGKTSISNSVELELSSSIGINSSDIECNLNIIAVGGNTVSFKDFDQYNENMENWAASTTNDNCSMIKITSLLPLWELLPNDLDTEDNKNKMINDFCNYVNDNEINYNYFETKSLRDFKELSLTFESERRNNEKVYTITHSGVKYQDFDIIDLNSSYFDIKKDIYWNGYKYFEITLSIDMREKCDGYQEILIFKNDNLYSTSDAIWHIHNYEYGGGKLKKEYSNIVFKTEKYDILTLLENDKRKLYIRYGANGWQDDDWQNKNLKVTITFTKC